MVSDAYREPGGANTLTLAPEAAREAFLTTQLVHLGEHWFVGTQFSLLTRYTERRERLDLVKQIIEDIILQE